MKQTYLTKVRVIRTWGMRIRITKQLPFRGYSGWTFVRPLRLGLYEEVKSALWRKTKKERKRRKEEGERMRPIDADKLKKDILDVYEQEFPTATGALDKFATTIVSSIISIQSTVDAVPIVRCKDCKYFEYDHMEDVEGYPIPLILAHEICTKWGNGCKTSENGYCFMGERKESK